MRLFSVILLISLIILFCDGKTRNTGSRSNYRQNLVSKTGGSRHKGFDAHHLYPQKYEKIFARQGINIHSPNNLQWKPSQIHRQQAYAYNQKWAHFLDQNPNKKQIIAFGNRMRNY